jgi:cellulose synthase/poly-beta-1,6-N-acetylglucosamine synthase-like glycosyltransferase
MDRSQISDPAHVARQDAWMSPLERAFAVASPRLSPRRVPAISMLIHGSVTALWLALFARAFLMHGVFAWSAGIAYIGYDTVLLCFVGWKTLSLMRPDVPSMALSRPTLGVIVAAHNEASVLPLTLAALFNQINGPQEILIADDGSNDGTAGLLASKFGLNAAPEGQVSAPSSVYPSLRWLRVPHGGKARALNLALTFIGTEVVMTVDADTLLEPDACDVMRRGFGAEPELVAAAGILTPKCDHTLSGRFLQCFQTYEYIRNFISRYAWMRADSLLLISGAFACFRRNAVLEVGGFDPECLVEDYELIHRLRRHAVETGLDWTVRVLGRAHASTDAPSTLPMFLRQRRRWFAGFLQTQYWNRDMTGNRRFGNVGVWMMPVKAIDTMQPIYGLTAFALLAVFLVDGHQAIAWPALNIISAKIVLDLGFHLWSIYLYRRWTGIRSHTGLLTAFAAAIIEPFSFQLLRHFGAALGWFHFFRGAQNWGKQSRTGLLAASRKDADV